MTPEEFWDVHLNPDPVLAAEVAEANARPPASSAVQAAVGKVHDAIVDLGATVAAEAGEYDGELAYRIALQRSEGAPAEILAFWSDGFRRGRWGM